MISANILAFYCVGEEIYCHAHASKNVDSMGAGRDEVARRGKGIILENIAASEGEPFASLDVEKSGAECQSSRKAHYNPVPISRSSRREGHYCSQAAGKQD